MSPVPCVDQETVAVLAEARRLWVKYGNGGDIIETAYHVKRREGMLLTKLGRKQKMFYFVVKATPKYLWLYHCDEKSPDGCSRSRISRPTPAPDCPHHGVI